MRGFILLCVCKGAGLCVLQMPPAAFMGTGALLSLSPTAELLFSSTVPEPLLLGGLFRHKGTDFKRIPGRQKLGDFCSCSVQRGENPPPLPDAEDSRGPVCVCVCVCTLPACF